MRDFCDAYFMKSHPIFFLHQNALQFILFYDDIEVANTVEAKAGVHKLGMHPIVNIYSHTILHSRSILLCSG